MPRLSTLIPACLVALAVLAAPTPSPAQEEPASSFDPFLDEILDDVLADAGTDGRSLLGTEFDAVVRDRASGLVAAAGQDSDVRLRRVAGLLKLGDAWARGAAQAGVDLVDGNVSYGSFDITPPDKKKTRRVKAEVVDMARISADLGTGVAETGKLRAKAMLKVQNRVLTRFLSEGGTDGVGWTLYVCIAYGAEVELKDRRIDAEILQEHLEERCKGPETKIKRRARDLVDKAVELLRDLEKQPGLLHTQWEIIGNKIESAEEAPDDKTSRGILRDAKQRERAHKKGWSRLFDGLFFANELLEKAEKLMERACDDGPPASTPEIPSWFPATVEPGDYHSFLLVNNGTGTGYIPQGWIHARVGDGRETIASRQQLWDRMRTLVTEAENDFTATFEDLYFGALGYDKRGAPAGFGEFIPIADLLARNAQAVADAEYAAWSFQDQISFPEWEGYLGTRNYQDIDGATTMRIVVAFIHTRTPPIQKPLQDNITPGEYRIYRALVLGPLVNGEVILPVRTVRITAAVELDDELRAEREALRTTFAETFIPHVAPQDVAEIQIRQNGLTFCGPATSSLPTLDPSRAPFFLLFDRWSCEQTPENPFPRAFNLTVGFERIGD